MENITITGTDNSTNLLFKGLVGSAGEGKPAIWRFAPDGAAPIQAAEIIEVSGRFNGPKTVRRMLVKITIPLTQTDTSTGKTSVTDRIPVEVTLPVLQGANPAVAEMVADRLKKILSSPVVVSQLASGYAQV